MRLFAWVAVGPGCIPAKGLKACGAGRLIGLLLATSVATAAGAGASPVAAAIGGASVTGQDAAAALTGLQEGNRYNAIANLVRTGQLRLPVSASDAAQILAGTTQGARAASIAELARVLKDDLTGQEATAVLGSATDLTDGNR